MGEQPAMSWDDVSSFLGELKTMAHALLRRESSAHSIQTTGLVLSALRRQKRSDKSWEEVQWNDREEFFRLSHRAMRQALIDHARIRKAARKRAAMDQQVLNDAARIRAQRGREADERDEAEEPSFSFSMDDLPMEIEGRPERVECLATALEDLEIAHPPLARVAQHALYSQLSLSEIARLLSANDRTIRDQYQRARAWLARRIRELCPELG